jgi:hypothetical protein
MIGEIEKVAKKAVDEERISGSLRFSNEKPFLIATRIVLNPPSILIL